MANGQEENMSSSGPLIEEARRYIKGGRPWKVVCVNRKANVLVHNLAKDASCCVDESL